MKSGSTIALAAAIVLAGSAAAAQVQAPQAPVLSPAERTSIAALQNALNARDYAGAANALRTAQSAARTGYTRYLASALQLRLGIETGDLGLQSSAIDAMISSDAAPASELPKLYRNQGALLQQAGKYEAAERSYTRWAELAPNDPEALLALAQVKNDRKKPREAVDLIEKALGMRRAAGMPIPEGWLKRAANLSLANQMGPQALAFTRDIVAAYPSAQNWRDAVLTYRDVARPDAAGLLDAFRLLRASKALAGERDYLQHAQHATTAGLPGEAKAVLEEGLAAKMIDPAKAEFKTLLASARTAATAERTGIAAKEKAALAGTSGTAALAAADTLFGQGEYARAAALYAAALQKGSVDPNLANSRLGAALALAGRRIEAEAALRAVTGPRADLAQLWLLWLARRA